MGDVHTSALLVQVPGLSQLIPGTQIRSYALFLPQVHQDVTVVADGVNGPGCTECAGVLCSVLFHPSVLCGVGFFLTMENLTVCQLPAVTHHFWICSGFVISIPASPPVERSRKLHNTFLFRALKRLAGVTPYKLLCRQVREVKKKKEIIYPRSYSKVGPRFLVQDRCLPALCAITQLCLCTVLRCSKCKRKTQSPVSLCWDWGIVLFARLAPYQCCLWYTSSSVKPFPAIFAYLYENQTLKVKS